MRKHLYLALLLMASTPLAGTFAAYADPVPQTQSRTASVITGTVMDENNEPVIGASVVVKGGKKQSVATDAFGNFKLKVAPGTKLEVSYVGYKNAAVAAADGMTVYLQPTTEMLNELVAVGYGTQKRANLTGAVATVDVARTMDSRPVQDVTKALQGAVPGLTIAATNGGIASEPTIRVRGLGTVSNGRSSSPLIVVDGVPVDNLSFVNPEDVAEISVLKDASSSAIYGSRAAFGVILITTKNANKNERVKVSYNNNFAWSQATTMPEFATTVQNIEAALQAYYRNPTTANSKTEVGGMPYADLLPFAKAWEQTHNGKYTGIVPLVQGTSLENPGDFYVDANGNWLRYADWDLRKTMFTEAAPSQKHNLTLEGTSGSTQFRMNVGYDTKQNLFKYNPDKMDRVMANVNVSTNVNKWLKAGTRINFSERTQTGPELLRNAFQYLWRWAPYMETYGTLVDPSTGEPLTFYNEYMNRTQSGTNNVTTRSTRLQGWVNAEIIKDLNLQADFTYDVTNMFNSTANLMYKGWSNWSYPAFTFKEAPTAGQSSTNARNTASMSDRWTANIFATYAKTFNEAHNLKTMLGFTAERYNYDYFLAQKNGLTDFNLPTLALTDGGKEGKEYKISASRSHRATAGFFGRVNYDYKGIYLLEANLRRDGSSNFPAADQWAWFPSFSAGYRFSDEAYFAPLNNIISNGKLRASYGEIGNEAVGANMFLSTITLGNSNVNWLNAGGSKLSSAATPALVSSSLTWERIGTTDVGVDLGFLNNEYTLSFDWFSRETRDMLAPGSTVPATLGAAVPVRNAGTMRTNGWEFSLGMNKSFGDAEVYATFNLSDARSKIVKWDNEGGTLYSYYPGESGYRFYEGQYYGDIWGFTFDRFFEKSDFSGKDANGKWQYGEGVANQDYLAYNPFTFGPGDVKFKDLNGDGVINNGNPDMIRVGGKTYVPGQAGYDEAKKNPDAVKVPVGTLDNHGDLSVVGNALPRFEYSLRVGGAWKGFDIDLFFQGVGKRDMWQISSFNIPFAAKNDGLFTSQLDYNKYIVDANNNIVDYEINQNNFWPVLESGTFGYNSRMRNTCNQGKNNFTLSDRYMVNMAYLRMKTITCGYTIPADITKMAKIERARVYFSAENPFMIYNGASRYGFDPEMNDAAAGEGVAAFGRADFFTKAYSFGLQVTF